VAIPIFPYFLDPGLGSSISLLFLDLDLVGVRVVDNAYIFKAQDDEKVGNEKQ
jgi:hypothetical protein